MGNSRGWRGVAAIVAAGGGAIAGATPAQAALEIRVAQPYVAAPSGVTVQVRSSESGTVALHQERLDRSGPGPGQQTPGWSCSLHLDSSRPGWQPAETPVARVQITTPGAWTKVTFPVGRLAFVGPQRADQIAWSTLLASLGVRVDSCIDPWTQFDRLAAYQPGQRPVGARLVRVF